MTDAYPTLVVSMAHASCHGSAIATKDGVVSSAIKVIALIGLFDLSKLGHNI